MRTASAAHKRPAKGKRSGIPLTVYLPENQAAHLSEICKERHVTKATIIRFAVDQLFVQLNKGQLELPLGLTNVN
jgi:hypothetical protein